MSFIDRLDQLIKMKGTNWNSLKKELNIGKNERTRWKDNGSLPNGETLVKLSKYFGCTADYLLGLSPNWGIDMDLGAGSTSMVDSELHFPKDSLTGAMLEFFTKLDNTHKLDMINQCRATLEQQEALKQA